MSTKVKTNEWDETSRPFVDDNMTVFPVLTHPTPTLDSNSSKNDNQVNDETIKLDLEQMVDEKEFCVETDETLSTKKHIIDLMFNTGHTPSIITADDSADRSSPHSKYHHHHHHRASNHNAPPEIQKKNLVAFVPRHLKRAAPGSNTVKPKTLLASTCITSSLSSDSITKSVNATPPPTDSTEPSKEDIPNFSSPAPSAVASVAEPTGSSSPTLSTLSTLAPSTTDHKQIHLPIRARDLDRLPPTTPSNIVTSYICKGHPRPGKFYPEKLAELDVEPGRNNGI
jgi:hypothetical protein